MSEATRTTTEIATPEMIATKIAEGMLATGTGEIFSLGDGAGLVNVASLHGPALAKALASNRKYVTGHGKDLYIVRDGQESYHVCVPSPATTLSEWALWSTEVLCTIYAAVLTDALANSGVNPRILKTELIKALHDGRELWNGHTAAVDLQVPESRPYLTVAQYGDGIDWLCCEQRRPIGFLEYIRQARELDEQPAAAFPAGVSKVDLLGFEVQAPNFGYAVAAAIAVSYAMYLAHAHIYVEQHPADVVAIDPDAKYMP